MTGCSGALPPGLLSYAARERGLTTSVFEWAPPLAGADLTGYDTTWSERYAAFVQEEMLHPERLPSTAFLAIEVRPGSARFEDGDALAWTNYKNHYARALADRQDLQLVAQDEVDDGAWALRVYVGAASPP